MAIVKIEYVVEAVNSYARVVITPEKISYSAINSVENNEITCEKSMGDFDRFVKCLDDYKSIDVEDMPIKDATHKTLVVYTDKGKQVFRWTGDHFEKLIKLIADKVGPVMDIGV